LRYALEQAPYEERLLELAERSGGPPPQAIQDKPTLEHGLDLYWDAYQDLQGERGDMGGPIRWSAIILWAQVHELDSRQTLDLVSYIQGLDAFHRDWMDKNRAKVQAQKDAASGTPKTRGKR
jgi:hypothetical protein